MLKAKQAPKDAAKDDDCELLEEALAANLKLRQDADSAAATSSAVSSPGAHGAEGNAGPKQQLGKHKTRRRTIKSILAEQEEERSVRMVQQLEMEQVQRDFNRHNPWKALEHKGVRDRFPLDPAKWLLRYAEPPLELPDDMPPRMRARAVSNVQLPSPPVGPASRVMRQLLQLLEPRGDEEDGDAHEHAEDIDSENPFGLGRGPCCHPCDLVRAVFEMDPNSQPKSAFVSFKHSSCTAQDAPQAPPVLQRAFVFRERCHATSMVPPVLGMHTFMFFDDSTNTRCPLWASNGLGRRLQKLFRELSRGVGTEGCCSP